MEELPSPLTSQRKAICPQDGLLGGNFMKSEQKHDAIVNREKLTNELPGQAPTADEIEGHKKAIIEEHKRRNLQDYEPEARLNMIFE